MKKEDYLNAVDILKDYDKKELCSEIMIFYIELNSLRDRISQHIKNPNSKVEKDAWEHCIKNKLAEVLFVRSFDNEDMSHLYANFCYYAKKLDLYSENDNDITYKENAAYIEKLYHEILNKFWHYKEYGTII